MQEIPGNDLFKDVAHYFLRTPHGDIEVQADKVERTVRCPECGQCPQLIEQWTHECATFACATDGCYNFMRKFEAWCHKGLCSNGPYKIVEVDLTFPSGICTINEDGSCSIEFKE